MLGEVLPIDVRSAKSFGLDKWQKSFVWPVSDSDYTALAGDIWAHWRQMADRVDEVGNAFLVKFNVAIECQHLLHAAAVIDGAKSMELQPLHSEGSFWYRDLLSRSDQGKTPGVLVKKAVTYRPGPFLQEVSAGGKKIVRLAWYNASVKKVSDVINGDRKTYVFGVPDERIRAYMNTIPNWVSVTAEKDWLSGDTGDEGVNEAMARSGASDFVSGIKRIADGHGVKLAEDQYERFSTFVFNELMDALLTLNRIRKKVSLMEPLHILLQQFGNPFQRALAIVVRERGGKVSGFAHGGAIGLFDSPTLSTAEFSLADEFITFSEASVPLFEAIRDRHVAVRGNRVEIQAIETNYFQEFRNKYCGMELSNRVRTVMVLGYPFHPWRKMQSSGGFALLHLDMELRVVKELHEKGYKVLYKAHPDRLNEASEIFDEYATVLIEEFRDCVDRADAIFIGSLKTSALPFALCTNKRVVAVAVDGKYKMNSEAYGLLKKRCSMLEAGFDDRGRIDVAGGAVCDALSGEHHELNTEFVNRYLLPKKS